MTSSEGKAAIIYNTKYREPLNHSNVMIPWGHSMAQDRILSHKTLNKFGMNDAVGSTFETVWDGQAPYVWPTTVAVASVTGGAEDIVTTGTGAWTINVSGLDADYNEYNEDVTMNAANAVLTTGTFLRIFRMKVLTAGTGGTNDADISATLSGTLAARILADYGQTLMALWTIPVGYTAHMVNMYANTSIVSKANETRLRTRPFGGAWNTKRVIHINGAGGTYIWQFPLEIAEKTDIEIQSKATDSGGDCAAGFDLWYEIH